MKLNRIEISNFIGIGRADIDMSKAVLVVSGENAVGKSSLADAVSCSFLGKPRRVDAKKELGQLLHNGAEKGRVSIAFDDNDDGAEFRLPKGDHHVSEFVGAEFMPAVLDPQLFARMSDDERRTFLFKLTAVKASPKLVGEKLAERGIDEDMIEEILPMMRSGFPAAAKECYARATQAKGVWRSITGSNWGSNIAEDWKAPAPEGKVPTEKDLQEIVAKVTKHQADLENGIKFIGEQEQAQRDHDGRTERLAKLVDTASLLNRRQAKLEADQAELAKWEAKLPELQDAVTALKGATVPLKCPCCDETLSMVDGQLVKYVGLKEGTGKMSDAALELTKAKDAVNLLRSTVAKDQEAIAESKAAAQEVESISGGGGGEFDDSKLQRARDSVQQLKDAIAQLRVDFKALEDLKSAAAKIDEKTTKAAEAHATVKAWNAAGDALAPDGIPGELLNDALAPVNQSIGVLAGMCGWSKAEVGTDMTITYGGRLYGLCSESEKWRADCLIALAIAQISQLRLVMLDRFDVLDTKSRQRLLGMLLKLDQLGAMDTMILCGTMKQPMPASPNWDSVWLQNGLAEIVTA